MIRVGALHVYRNEMFVDTLGQIISIRTTDPPYRLQGKYWNLTAENTYIAEFGSGVIG